MLYSLLYAVGCPRPYTMVLHVQHALFPSILCRCYANHLLECPREVRIDVEATAVGNFCQAHRRVVVKQIHGLSDSDVLNIITVR